MLVEKLDHTMIVLNLKICLEIKESTIDLDMNPKYLEYIDYLDQGGLIYPSYLLFKILQVSYTIFNVCVGGDLEDPFLKHSNQKHTLITAL